MSNAFHKISKNIVDHIKYRTTVMTGEITKVNNDGTYNIKIAQSGAAYPNVETLDYNAFFSRGEIVDIAFEYGSRELPKIMGTAKKIAQEPKEVEVDYSGEKAGGRITETVTINSVGNISDGYLAKQGLDYNTAHNAEVADVIFTTEIPAGYLLGIGYVYCKGTLDPEQWPADWHHTIYRTYLYFDTSSIPVHATITDAKLYIYKHDMSSSITDAFDVVIQNGQPDYPSDPLTKNDYNKNFYSNNGGSINSNSLLNDSYSNIILNSNGRAWINKDGITKLCLRSSREIAGISWNVNEEEYVNILGIYSSEQGEGYRPYLTITYEY